jgi:hypothetical protein
MPPELVLASPGELAVDRPPLVHVVPMAEDKRARSVFVDDHNLSGPPLAEKGSFWLALSAVKVVSVNADEPYFPEPWKDGVDDVMTTPTAWAHVASPNAGGSTAQRVLAGVTATSASNAWVVGER